jgi:hypothetical protein
MMKEKFTGRLARLSRCQVLLRCGWGLWWSLWAGKFRLVIANRSRTNDFTTASHAKHALRFSRCTLSCEVLL